MMKNSIILLLMIFLTAASCKQAKVVCKQIRKTDIKALPLCDISFQFNRCTCSCYDLETNTNVNDKYCGEGFESKAYPLETCEGLAGFFVEDWAKEVIPKIKKLNTIKKDYCN